MGEWSAKLLPAAAAMLGHKKASERQKGIELYAAIADPETIPKLEEARDNDRSKKLRRDYEQQLASAD